MTDRFQRQIQPGVNKFNGCYKARKATNESGKSNDGILQDAFEDFKLKNNGKAFKFEHCLEVLWDG
jgi:hypothetical protein